MVLAVAKNTTRLLGGVARVVARAVARVFWVVARSLLEAVARMFWVVVRSFHGPSYTIESQWGNFGTLLPPRGATLTPF